MARDILVTGAAGFIGFHFVRHLRASTDATIVGIDNIDDYYDPELKRDRLQILEDLQGFEFIEQDLTDHDAVRQVFRTHTFDEVVHLAARPGVRASTEYPEPTVKCNIDGFLSVLEGCRHHGIDHLVYASSSSVYGPYCGRPLSEHQPVDHPASLYAATKVSNEAMAHSYADLYDIPTTGLRFFTVYGPWGRPDMAYYLFADAIASGEPIEVFNHGEMERDFTYVGDVVDGIGRVLASPPEGDVEWSAESPDPASSRAPYRLYNIGRGEPVPLMKFIDTIERAMGREADKRFREMPPGDVESTHADVTDLSEDFDYRPTTDLTEGIGRFIEWYHRYHGVALESAAE
jgi:UDP-glucuronate 4-epimerase